MPIARSPRGPRPRWLHRPRRRSTAASVPADPGSPSRDARRSSARPLRPPTPPDQARRSTRPTINLTTARDRAVDRRPGHLRRRHHPRRDRRGHDRPGRPDARPPRRGDVFYPAGRRRDDARPSPSAARRSRSRSRSRRPPTQPPISFQLDVMPVFMRAGCNTGSCHGAARGKDGFRLSLFGFDPDGDHYRLTREMIGRRINLAVPAESLLLEKAIGAGAAHRRQAVRGRQRATTRRSIRWLEAGAPQRRRRQAAHGRRRRALPARRPCSTARARRSR